MSSKAKHVSLPLPTLRRQCGVMKNGRWVYQPIFLKPPGKPGPPKVLATLPDKRLLAEVEADLTAAMQQVLARAYAGDSTALHRFARIVCGAVETLGRLAEFRPGKTKAIAETFSSWPVLLSLNPQQIQHAKTELARLGVGTKAPVQTRKGQRLDPQNFWTRLAADAFEIIRFNRKIVPVLKAHCRGGAKRRTERMLWSLKLEATIYTLPEGEIIVIPDWCGKVCQLSEPVTNANLDAWWKAVRLCVLDYWKLFPNEYQNALRQIGQPDEAESRRRHFALDRVKQALRSLV